MLKFLRTYFKGDSVIWLVYITMLICSLVAMYSASSSLAWKGVGRGASFYSPVVGHGIFLLAGFGVVALIHRVSFQFLSRGFCLAYCAGVILVLTTLFGGVTVNGATRWLNIGGVLFQPSEVAKVTTVLFLASRLSYFCNSADRKPDDGIWQYLFILGIPCFLIGLENLSTCLLLASIGFLMMYFACVSWKLLLKMVGAVILIGAVCLGALFLIPDEKPNTGVTAPTEQAEVKPAKSKSIFHRATTWRNRIIHFFDEPQPHDDNYRIQDASMQEDRAKIAIANGKTFGMGIGNSIQRDFLPLGYADFIFSIMVEEIGFFAIGILILYLVFIYRVGIMVKNYCNSVVQSLVVLGLSSMILMQVYINIFIAVGLFPVSGQPLPLFSRGGTSILITSFYFGMILCVSRTVEEEQNNKKSKPEKKKAE